MTVHVGGIRKLKRGEMVWVRAFPLMPCGMNGAPRDVGGASERQPQIAPLPLVGRNDSTCGRDQEAQARGDGLGSCFPTHALWHEWGTQRWWRRVRKATADSSAPVGRSE